ncbi:MAG TPA: DinB family protein [Actinomycetota bacterium]|nr:DinB family protein [Actinomycetota bacterium]
MEERIVAPDPVEDPKAYQQAILDLLGDLDPLDVLASTAEKIEDACAELDLAVLQKAPEPGEWSAEEILAHLLDAEVVNSFRWRLTLAQDNPTLHGFDQDSWAKLAHPSFPEMFAAFSTLRRANVWLAEETPTERWSKSATHAERGPQTFELLLQTTAGHDLAHLKQLEQTLAAVQG